MKNNKIEITQVFFSNRKTIAIEIKKDGSLIVRAPKRTPMKYINEIVEKKSNWITEKQLLVKQRNENILTKELKQGEPVLLMGKIHFLEIVSSNKSGISADGNKILIDEKFSSNLKAALTIFFKIYAKNIIPLRFGFIKQRLKIHINGIKISNAERRWGSCSLKKNLNFNWRLAMVPPEVIDYVIIHEIAHLREMNHSDRFWSIVSSMMPDYKIRKKWLKDNDHLMKW